MAATIPVTEAETVLAAPVKAGEVLDEVPEAWVPLAPVGVVAEPGVPVGVEVPEAPGVPLWVAVPIYSD